MWKSLRPVWQYGPNRGLHCFLVTETLSMAFLLHVLLPAWCNDWNKAEKDDFPWGYQNWALFKPLRVLWYHNKHLLMTLAVFPKYNTLLCFLVQESFSPAWQRTPHFSVCILVLKVNREAVFARDPLQFFKYPCNARDHNVPASLFPFLLSVLSLLVLPRVPLGASIGF